MSFIIHSASLGSTVLPGVTGHAIEVGRESHRPVTASNRWNRLASVARYLGTVNLTTTGIKALLDAMPQGSGAAALPYPCCSLAANNLTLWQLKQDDILPALASGSVHERMVIAAGLASLSELSWGGVGQPVQARVQAWPLSADGDASYWAKSQQAAPASPPLEADFEVESVTWGGVAIPEVGNLQLSIQAPINPVHPVGKLYPTKLSAVPSSGVVAVTARLQVPDAALLRSYGEHFAGGALGNLVITMSNFAMAAERGALSVTLTLRGTAEVAGATAGRPGQTDLLISSVQDATDGTHPFSWATA